MANLLWNIIIPTKILTKPKAMIDQRISSLIQSFGNKKRN